MSRETKEDDERLWALARGGIAEAFGELFERHCDLVYNFAFRRTGSWDAAEEAAATAFLEAWRQRDRIELFQGSLRPWLLGVTNNIVRRGWRTTDRANRALERLAVVEQAPDHSSRVVAQIDGQRRLLAVLRRVEGLPEAQRDVLLLWAWEQLSYDEIAVVLGIPMGTVRSRLNRARSALSYLDEGTGLHRRASQTDVRSSKERCVAGDGYEGGLT